MSATGWTVVLGVIVGGCGGVGESGGGGGDVGSDVVAEDVDSAPDAPVAGATEVDTIRIEGMAEAIEVQRVESPPGFAAQFTTTAPADMRVDFIEAGEGQEARFTAAFAGTHTPAATFRFVPLPGADSEVEAREQVAAVAGQHSAAAREPPLRDWAVEEYALSGERSGFIGLGRAADVWYYFQASYPPEYGDGMGPRIDLILRNWRWMPEGEPLTRDSEG
ncbi:MAG: hypothetical protein WD737_09105 [Gemmatimonadota bacterium]